MNQKYPVQLTETEPYQLKPMISSGTVAVRKTRRAQILLKSDSSVRFIGSFRLPMLASN